jgi:uncharacterized protein YaaQ
MLLAIIQQDDVQVALAALNDAGLRVTHLSSVGGFLEAGNATLLLGLEEKQIARATSILAEKCRQRTVLINAARRTTEFQGPSLVAPVEAQVGGATIFALPVERYVRFGGQSQDIQAEPAQQREDTMKLILAVVPEDQARRIADGLIAAQYRATLISTTGGFWRKGNATLLIGVEDDQVDDVLRRIQAICLERLPRADTEEACANIFVLDVRQQIRV